MNPRRAADRRRFASSSEEMSAMDPSSRSTSLTIALQTALALEEKLAREAAESTEALQRMLSLRSVISTTSSFAEREQAAVGQTVDFREIGKGSIGAVFEHPGTNCCYKLPLTNDPYKLWNNYKIQLKVQEAFAEANGKIDMDVEVPRAIWFANKDTDKFWNESLDRFPWTEQFPKMRREAVCMQRILPLPKPIRDHLVDRYCLVGDKEAAKSYPPNKDCLVRPLLGRRRYGSGGAFFSLRNFRLHVDQFEELGLDMVQYAIAMADAMAILHGIANIDAMDIEFVVGSTPSDIPRTGHPPTSADVEKMNPLQSTMEQATLKDFRHRILTLWVLDFDACSKIKVGEPAGIEAAVKAFMETEPYCPRPSDDPHRHELWGTFGTRYIQTSKKLGKVPQSFAVGFLNGVEKGVQAARSAGQGTPASLTPSNSRASRQSGRASHSPAYRHSSEGQSGSGGPKRDLSGDWRKK